MNSVVGSIRDRFELTGRSYIVTCGAMGIGYAIVHDICEVGGNVAVLHLREMPLEGVYGLVQQFRVKSEYFQTDVSDGERLRLEFDNTVAALGRVADTVTAAGNAINRPFVNQNRPEANKILQVNSMGSFFATQMAAQQMQKQGTLGSIVMTASITSHVNLPG